MARNPLESRIASLRGRVRRLLALQGTSRVVVGFVLAVAVAGVLDWLIHLVPEVRLALLVTLIGLVGWLAAKHVVSPLLTRFADLDIALKVERRWPGLNDRLSSTLEFLRVADQADDERHGSRRLREVTIENTLKELDSIDFREVVDPRPARRATLLSASVLAVGVGIVVLAPQLSSIAMARLFRPFGGPDWPKQTHLEFVDAPTKVARGEPFAFAVAVRQGDTIPPTARVTYRFPDGESQVETLAPDAEGRFLGRLESVNRDFSFRVEAGDDATDRHEVAVVPPPAIRDLMMTVEPPAYTTLGPQVVAPGRTQVKAVLGSTLDLAAVANKPLKSATLRRGDGTISQSIELDPTSTKLRLRFGVEESGPFWFELLDTEGFASREVVRYDLQATKDEPPRVTLDEPISDKEVTADALVPIRATIDDDFGIQKVRLVDKIAAGNSEPTRQEITPLYPAEGVAALAKHLEVTYSWNLAPLKLEAGAIVTFFADALDRDDLNGPNLGKSRELRLRVVSKDDYKRILDDKQRDIREEIQRARDIQNQARTGVQEARRLIESGDRPDPKLAERLRSAGSVQRQVTNRLNNPTDGLDSKARRLREDIDNNKIDSPETREQLDRLLTALERIKEQNLAPAEQGITQAAKALENADSGDPDNGEDNADLDPNRPAKDTGPSRSQTDTGKSPDSPPKGNAAEKKGEPNAGGTEKSDTNPRDTGKSAAEPRSKAEPPKSGDSKSDASSKAGSPKSAASKNEASPGDSGKSQPQGQSGDSTKSSPDKAGRQEGRAEQALARAEENQQAIAEDLGRLLDDLGEFETQKALQQEASKIRDELDQALKDMTELGERDDLAGMAPEKLNGPQKAELNNAAERIADQSKRLQELENRMEQMGQRMENSDPLAARGLQDTADASRERGTSGKLNDAAGEMQQNRLGQSKEQLQQAREDVEKMIDELKNRRSNELSKLVKELKKAGEEMQSLRERQARNLMKTQDAKANPDAARRAEELKKLAREQEQIQKDLDKQIQKLKKLRSDMAAQAGSKAGGKMSKAQQNLDDDEGDEAEQQMRDALKDLEDAQEEIEEQLEEAKDRLANEQLVKMADTLRQIAERHGQASAETSEFEARRIESGDKLTNAQRSRARSLGQIEIRLKDETSDLIERMEGAPVFTLTLKKAAESLDVAGGRLRRSLADDETQLAQKSASRRFQQLLDALKSDKNGENGGQQGGQQGGGGGQQNGGGGGDGIPAIAQIKMLKQIQEEINNRTSELDEIKRRGKELTEAQRAEMDRLKDDQHTVADLAREITKPARADGED